MDYNCGLAYHLQHRRVGKSEALGG